jgi:hypothetical protein
MSSTATAGRAGQGVGRLSVGMRRKLDKPSVAESVVALAVGRNVGELQPGDEACAGAGSDAGAGGDGVLAPKPANLGSSRPASVPTSAQTALQGLRDAGRVRAGLSRRRSEHTFRSIGADDVIDHARGASPMRHSATT